jgi:ParB family transcriptional regulator, chromosome partitioning protein
MNDKRIERRGLGRGLSALMADINVDQNSAPSQAEGRRGDLRVAVENLFPNPDQPRRDFLAGALEDLAASIRQKGVLQPLIVRPTAEAGRYEIVAGERRWRAAQMAQVHEVPVIVREFSDTEVLEVAIIENIQRADLNAMEEAAGFRQLMDRFGHTQEKIAEALSKSRSHVANLLRLLHLPQEVQSYIREGKLTAGHARALITTENPSELAREVISKGLSVRETERLTKQLSSKPDRSGSKGASPRHEKDADTRALEGDLSANLKMGVSIYHEPGGDKGTLTIYYNTLDDLDALCQALSGLDRG